MKESLVILPLKVFVVLWLWAGNGYAFAQKIKVACIGDSVTFGYGIPSRDSLSYPAQLQGMLGNEYQVLNFGKSGATLLRKGHNPFLKSDEFKSVQEFSPDIAIIHLGLNDTDPRNWPAFQIDFESDYAALIDSLKESNPTVRIFVAELSPIFSGHPRFKSGTRDWHKEIREKIRNVAQNNEVELLDFHSHLHARPDLLPDQIHPNEVGAQILAQTVYQNISRNFGGLSLDPMFQNGAVVQQGEVVQISGKGNPEDSITVVLDGKKTTIVTDQKGEWVADLKELTPGGPYPLEVNSLEKRIIVDSLWIGDVWLALGQSNMDWPLSQSNDGIEASRLTVDQDWPKVFKFHSKVSMNDEQWDSSTLQTIQNLDFFEANWASGTALKSTSGVAYFFAKQLQENLQIPIGIIQISVGGAPLESFLNRESLENDDLLVDMLSTWEKSDFIMPWVRQRAAENLGNAFESSQRHPFEPAYLHESMILQIMKAPIKGVLWYQGESNVHNPFLYERMFKIFVEDIRKIQDRRTPVYMVQLPGMSRPEWPYFREMQAKLASSIPETHVIVTLDLGDSLDVHPTNKEEVGKRLANKALTETYHVNGIQSSNPSLNHIEIEDNQIVLNFKSTGDLKTNNSLPVKGFELVDSKGRRKQVEVILLRNSVVIKIPEGFDPKEIWYSFSPFPSPNLTDNSGLPVPSFRKNLMISNSL